LKKHIVSNVGINMKMNITKIAKPSNNYFLLQVMDKCMRSVLLFAKMTYDTVLPTVLINLKEQNYEIYGK